MSARGSRHLEWEGAFNVRDLGGLPARDGAATRWGAIVRADSLSTLSDTGWEALVEHGVRTILDLRSDFEITPDLAARPRSLTTVRLPLDAHEDREFWESWEESPGFGTPMYYRPHLERFPQRSAAVIAAIARAQPGGVAFHCVAGRDRSGQIAMLVLALLGVSPLHIAEDYELSRTRLERWFAARGEADHGLELEAFLRERGTSARELVMRTLAELDVEACMLAAGLGAGELEALRKRALER